MKVNVLVSEWVTYQNALKKYSKATIKGYRCRIEQFARHMGEDATIDQLTPRTVQDFFTKVAAEKPRNCRMLKCALSSWCEWLIVREWLNTNPCAKVELPKLPKGRRQPVPDDIIGELLRAASRIPNRYKARLARAALSLLTYGGLRRSEVIRLTMQDVDLDSSPNRASIYLYDTKGRQQRKVYVGEDCIEDLKAYLELRLPARRQDEPFFLWRTGIPMGYDGVASLLKTTKAIAGMRDRKLTEHQLRHSAAVRLYRKTNHNLLLVQAFLGHSDPATTLRYLHLEDGALEDAPRYMKLENEPPAPVVDARAGNVRQTREKRTESRLKATRRRVGA